MYNKRSHDSAGVEARLLRLASAVILALTLARVIIAEFATLLETARHVVESLAK